MSGNHILMALVLLIALASVAGGILALLKQQVVVDKSGNPSEIELPWFGKIKTNYPSIFAVALGIVLAAFVATRLTVTITVGTIPVAATIETDGLASDAYIMVAAFPQRYLIATNQADDANNRTVEMVVDEPGPYYVFAMSPIRTASGAQSYAITQGPASLNETEQKLMFTGRLISRTQ